MVIQSLVIRTTISSALIKRSLFKGFSIAFLGILGLLFGGIFVPLPYLKTWGLILFLLSLGFITVGLLPYRRLTRLQVKPNELVMVDADHLTFYSKGIKRLTIPLQSIARMNYISHPTSYGIAVWLKPQPPAPVIVHQAEKELNTLRQQGQQIARADLFFPYFNQRAYEELVEWQKEEQEQID